MDAASEGSMSTTARKAGRAIKAACPPWLVTAWVIAGCIPTPFEIDEIIPAVLTILVLAFQWRRIPRGWSAWKGGKSHRAYDMRMAS